MATERKNLKYRLLENRKSYSLNIWHEHCLVSVYQVSSNKCPGVKIGPAPGVIVFPFMYIVKT
jgi:hypothetical protein